MRQFTLKRPYSAPKSSHTTSSKFNFFPLLASPYVRTMDRPTPSLSSVLALTTAVLIIVLVFLLVTAGLAGSHVLRTQARTTHTNDVENLDRHGKAGNVRSNSDDQERMETQRPQAPTPCTGMRYEDMCSTCTKSTNQSRNLLHSGASSSVYSVPTPTPSLTSPVPAKARAGDVRLVEYPDSSEEGLSVGTARWGSGGGVEGMVNGHEWERREDGNRR
ncbi:hypothetical protein FB567DRAFT_550552 [Paraphoma chrysanthemicola]|uniref:Uncharacterized protein n=1 Tax=Paraphoma chrysanthemicola TaxID=798071 RepID=A0A8K0R369_9PLEO|nr:hypothetical protein FB567DRAFT_550552 [Paraphoma chrysanthemicola]